MHLLKKDEKRLKKLSKPLFRSKLLSSQSQASLLPPLKQPIVPENYFEKSQQMLNQALIKQRRKSEATREALKSRDSKVKEPPVSTS